MNIRQIIRNKLSEEIYISQGDIEAAVENILDNLDLAETIQEAIDELLPAALTDTVQSIVEEEVHGAVEDAIAQELD